MLLVSASSQWLNYALVEVNGGQQSEKRSPEGCSNEFSNLHIFCRT